VASGPGAQPVLEDPATSSPNLAHELQSGSSSSTATSTGTSTSHSAGVPNASPSSSNTKSTAGAASGRGGGGGLELVVEDVSGGSGGESLRLTAGLVVNCAGEEGGHRSQSLHSQLASHEQDMQHLCSRRPR
jgi:hypothetical protein